MTTASDIIAPADIQDAAEIVELLEIAIDRKPHLREPLGEIIDEVRKAFGLEQERAET